MEKDTMHIVASNLTIAYYNVNKGKSEMVTDSSTKEQYLPMKIFLRTYRAFLTELKHSEKELIELENKLGL